MFQRIQATGLVAVDCSYRFAEVRMPKGNADSGHQKFRVKMWGFEVEGTGPIGMTLALCLGAGALALWFILPAHLISAIFGPH
jgi:hypothetical protein